MAEYLNPTKLKHKVKDIQEYFEALMPEIKGDHEDFPRQLAEAFKQLKKAIEDSTEEA